MMKFILLYIVSLFLIASDNKGNINFNIDYPIEYTIDVTEKTYILYQTPVSQDLSQYKFNRIVVQGEVNDPNINFEIWIPQNIRESQTITYSTIYGKSKIFPNGRFWVSFDLNNKIDKFKIVVINNGVKKEKFNIKIYEVQAIDFIKKKSNSPIESSFTDDKSLSLPTNIPFKLIRRADWQANSPTVSYIQHTPQKITIHHTAGNYPQTYEDALSEIQFIQDYHQNAKGWIDIGYHFLIDPLGNIFEGRPILVVGAHVANKNTDNIGIAVMGYYHPPVNDNVAQKTLDSIVTLAKYIKNTYGIISSSFAAHRDLAVTDCPGDILYSKIADLHNSIFNETEISINVDEINFDEDEYTKKLINLFDY